MGSDEITRHQHLPGYLGIPAFIRVHEAGDAQAEKKEHAAENQEEEERLVEPLESRGCFHISNYNHVPELYRLPEVFS